MINVKSNLDKNLYLACSGGVDSMAALDFLNRKHNVTVLHFNHETPNAKFFETTVKDFCEEIGVKCITGNLSTFSRIDINERVSLEEFWRNARYEFFENYTDMPVVTCHHLDDCVEQFLFSSIRHGVGKVIPFQNRNVVRPFRLTEKKFFQSWAEKNNLPFYHDESNDNVDFDRNYIRHEMMPHVLRINPGIKKVIRKIIKNENLGL